METICTDNVTEAIAARQILSALDQLKQMIEHHRRLLTEAFGTGRVGGIDSTVDEPADNGLLRQALYETIETLEETRKAFKSKRLEILRKKLMKVLMETQ